jgi:exopolysaccharide biosynthesis polyprenyl glycosylphosphotransferase
MQPLESRIDTSAHTAISFKIESASQILPRQMQWQLYRLILILSDIIMIGVTFRFAYFLRFESGISIFHEDVLLSLEYYRTLVFFLTPLYIAVLAILGAYNRHNCLSGSKEYSIIFRASTISFLLVIIIGFLEPQLIIARGWILTAWLLTFIFTSLGRFFLRRVVRYMRVFGFFLSPTVIIGANQEGRWLAQQLLNWKASGLHIVGYVDKKEPATTPLFHNLRSLGSVDQLDWIIKTYEVEELILASSAYSSRDALVDIFKTYGVSDKLQVRMSSGLYEVITTGLTVNEIAYVPLVHVNKVRLTGIDNAIKSILDFLLTISGLILFSPILIIISIAVKLNSPGPIIHRRKVMGVNGRVFDAYKFRTMYINGDEILAAYPELKEELESNYKLKDDPRITNVGQFLRKWSLDELPQLINVLKREMSLVGPRMISPEEVEKYKQFDINLLTVRPGLTGMWQVSGRSDVLYDERVQLDMYYVRNWSVWLDFQLLYQTIPAVLRSRGAY